MFKVNYFHKKFHHRCFTPLYRIPVNKKNTFQFHKTDSGTKYLLRQWTLLMWACCESWTFQKLFLFIILPFDMLCILFRPANPSRNYMYQIGKKQLFIKVLNLFKVNKKDIWTTSTEVSLISLALTLNTFSIVVF